MGAMTRRERVVAMMRAAQQTICDTLENLDRTEAEQKGEHFQHSALGTRHSGFKSETWERPGGGGGTARVLTDGATFERAGVNVSAIYGEQVPPSVWQERPNTKGQPYFVTGISMVLHPRNPYAPAFHANFRYFEAGDDYWFGGGMDMTPAYGFDDDARHFHRALKATCDRFDRDRYPAFKATCDRYFFLKHRNEMRGIGGIFFDNLHLDGDDGWEQGFAFVKAGTETILPAYLPIVERRTQMPYGERERQWQLYRRGRYVEFNLVYDRGTVFGLQTGGNIEAILMSLPPLARWEFHYVPEPNSPEADVARFLQPHDWASEG